MPPVLTLLSRRYCHLCHDMEQALEPLKGPLGFELRVVDVDADDALEAQYGELVPVLLFEGREICHYFLDLEALRSAVA